MTREYLLESAREIAPAGESASREYMDKADRLVSRINERMLDREDVSELVGADNIEMMKDNHANHVRFIGSMLHAFDARVLVETVLWVFRAYRSRGFRDTYWAAQLNGWVEILREELSPEAFREVYPIYEWMQVNIPLFVRLSENEAPTDEPGH